LNKSSLDRSDARVKTVFTTVCGGSSLRLSGELAMDTRSFERRRLITRFGCAALVVCAAGHAAADPIEDFYKGKTVNLILSTSAGGGYSSYAQAFAPYLAAHIPGHPQIVVQNMPGAGGIRAMIYLQNVAPKDGSTIGFVHSSVPLAPLFGIRGAKFDPRRMNWLGSLNTTPAVCVFWHASHIDTPEDFFKKPISVGGAGAGSSMETIPAVLNRFFGTHIKIVSGYKGGNEIYLAMERGEVDGRCAGGLVSSIKSTRPGWFARKKVTMPVAIAFARNPLFPDAPPLADFAKDDMARQVLRLELVPQDMNRPFLVPPGTPPERVAGLRRAFRAAFDDPGFKADAARMGLEINYVDGPTVADALEQAYAVTPDVLKVAGEAMNLTGAASK
jgi:tripartite-type tricarboxylate transporter receptor subunit TctC